MNDHFYKEWYIAIEKQWSEQEKKIRGFAHPGQKRNIKWLVVDFIFLKQLLQLEIQSVIVPKDGCTDLVKRVSKDFIWLWFVSSQYSCISGSLTLAFYNCNPRQSFTMKILVFLFFLCICSFEKPFKRNCSLHAIIAISST